LVLVTAAGILSAAVAACDMSPEYPVLDGNERHSSLKYEPPEETVAPPSSAKSVTTNTAPEEPPMPSEPTALDAEHE
jgi:hypothetical protein